MDDGSAAALIVATTHARTLTGLREWPPVGALIETLMQAARGGEGLTAFELRRLQSWSSRWGACPPTVREFYEAHAEDGAVSACLWYLLGDYRPSDGARGRVHGLFTSWQGQPANETLFPSLRHLARHTRGLTSRDRGSDDK